ncbi:MAG: hypothetical protein LBQ22_08560 [Bacteroidales bacterium]|jgi:hypothetical protein|nr:hypothetical protein [Bacteroidales bacterium]
MKRILYFLTFLFISTFTYSQTQESPVKWTVNEPVAYEGGFIINVIAEIDKDWYIYGMQMEEGGPLPLLINFENVVELIEKYEVEELSKAEIVFDEIFGMNVTSHSHLAEIKCFFVPKPGVALLNLIIDGQACNKKDGSCMPVYEIITIEIK